MARPKEFEREAALGAAIGIFCDTGFEGTSTDALLRGMGISRQSMYDTFGDKRGLYLEALRHYIAESVAEQIRALSAQASALKGIEAVLHGMATAAAREKKPGCMGIGAVSEFGQSDPEISALIATADRTLMSALERCIRDGKASGEIGADLEAHAAAEFVKATLSAIKIAARGGASPQTLQNIARTALRSLK